MIVYHAIAAIKKIYLGYKWSKLNPPDENNLCTWAMRCLLIETGDRKILIDTGMGDKQDARFRSHIEVC